MTMNDDRIDHAAEAHEYEKEACGAQRIGEESAEAMATLSLMKMVAALVEQQRIANVIAIANNVSEDPDVIVTDGERAAWLALCDEESPHSLRPEIREALGLRE